LTEIRFEDRFEYQLLCALYHSIADTGNLKRSGFAVAFRDFYLTIRLGLVYAASEIISDFRKELFESVGLDIVKALTIDSRGSAVSLGSAICFSEDFDFRDVYEKSPEAMGFLGLRLSIYPPSQFLHINGRLYHLTRASR
jgi:hypothetical protein